MIEINKPVVNPELLESMNKFLNDKSAENELILIEKINQSHLLTPVIVSGEVEDCLIEEGSTVSFKTISNTNDESYFIAFTDWDELGKWSKDKEQTLIYTCDDLNGIVIENINTIKGFVINPYSQRFIITPEVMQYFSQRKSEIVVEEDTKIMLGQPAVYPNELVNAMSKFFESCQKIKSAYLFLACKEGDQKSNLLFVIDFVGEKDLLFPKIAANMQEYMSKGEYFDMITMASSLGTRAVKNSTPFYKRKTQKLF